jgi:alpha-tubulin suppressor-like RCC1 family protein
MIAAVSVAQTTASISASLRSQNWNSMADEAAQAGVSYAYSCLKKNGTNYWDSSLKPSTSCSGGSNGKSAYISDQAASGESPHWRSSFTVSVPDSNNRATVKGMVELVSTDDTVTKTWVSDKVVVISIADSTPAAAGLAAGGSDTCILLPQGDVYCAGLNTYGQLGNGTTTNSSTPVKFQLPSGLKAIKMYADGTTTCVIVSGGDVYCAGYNGQGKLGNGNTTNQSTPVKFQLPSGLDATDLAMQNLTAGNNICVLTSDSSMYCSGYNSFGQLGNGSTATSSTPVKFQLPGTYTATAISVGSNMACALASSGDIYCAGRNNVGQLGDGTTTNQSTPVRFQLPAGYTATKVSAGFGNVCGITSNGNAYCAGSNNQGQLGNGNTTAQSVPVRFNLSAGLSATYVTSNGSYDTCAVTTLATVYCAGNNGEGQLGNGTKTLSSTPVNFQLPAGATATSISPVVDVTICALTSDGDVYCSGNNIRGEIGNGSTIDQSTPAKFQLPSGLDAVSISRGTNFTCVLTSDSNAYCSGSNSYGQLGNGTTTDSSTPVKFQLPAS